MYFVYKLFTLLILSFSCFAGNAQIASSFNFSPVISSTSGEFIGGNPIEIKTNSTCLQVSAGLSIFSVGAANNGIFGGVCILPPPFAIVAPELMLYPNPTHGISILKCWGIFDSGLSSQLKITGLDGRVYFTQTVTMLSLQAGIQINIQSYPSGVYLISVGMVSGNSIAKLIKL